jgi:methylated-DNA-[protein]-cysteine S-methyltransferase
VWNAIAAIPPGRTRTYTDLARTLKTAPRPVGGACGANRLPLVIPCHRVVAARGIGGFMNARSGSPLEVKRWLLRHEGSALA